MLTVDKEMNVEVIFTVINLYEVTLYDFYIFTVIYLSLHGFIWNQLKEQLPVGLLAQLVEHCTSIAEVMGSNPIRT